MKNGFIIFISSIVYTYLLNQYGISKYITSQLGIITEFATI